MNLCVRFILLFSVFSVGCFAQYSGRVYVDENRNGIFDKGEKLLKGVSVSDGLDVTVTDNNGIYHLDGYEGARFIFITTPSGYYTNNSYFRYIKNSADNYDFGVYTQNERVAKDGSHKFVHISDTEIGGMLGHEKWVDNIREYSYNEKVAFVMHTGDICYENGLKNHLKMMNTENMNVPVFYSIGNHDLVNGEYGEQLYESIYGPVYYSFEVGNVHYIVLPMPYGDFKPSYSKEDVYNWMKNDLSKVSKGKSIMIFCHDLLIDGDDLNLKFSESSIIDLEKYNVKAWLYGHWHVNSIYRHKSFLSVCTSSVSCGGIDHASAAFRVLSVDGKGYPISELRYPFINRRIKIASINNSEIVTIDSGNVPVYVNVYNSVSPVCEVNCKAFVDDKEILAFGMRQFTNMAWGAECKLPRWCNGRYITFIVEAKLANGEVIKTSACGHYDINNKKSVKLGDDWCNLLSDVSHTGVNESSVNAPLKLNWINNIGGNVYMSSPVVSDGKVFIATSDEDFVGKSFVVAVDAFSGKEVWRFKTEYSIKNSISVLEGTVLAQDAKANLYALDMNTGRLKWKKELGWDVVPPLDGGLISAYGIVYAGSGKILSAIDVKTGKQIWKNQDWKVREGCTVTLSADDNVLIGGAHWDAMYANDVHTGKLLWKNDKLGLRHRSSSPVIKNGIVYVLSLNSVFKINASDGKIISVKELGYNVDVTSSPLVTDDFIVFGTTDRGVVALDINTMKEKWNFKTSPSLIFSAPYSKYPACTIETSVVLSGNIVYFTASDGIIYGVELETGKLCWKYEVGAPFFASPALSGNALFVADFGGNVYCFTSNN